MKYSQMPFKTLREAPRDAETVNQKLLVQAGFVRQLMAGVYTYLPLGLRVLNKIAQVVREEMDAVGGKEILMPLLHPANIWKQSGGWDAVEVLFKLKSRTEKEFALAQSHEEVVTPLAREFIHSHKDLPLAIYHIQWKFRDELRSKSGILRGREFYMKDLYSWHADQEDFDRYYEQVKQAYLKIFGRLGLVAKVTEASGGAFTQKVSYEFEVLTGAGEASILYCNACEWCINTDDFPDKYTEGEKCPKCGKGQLNQGKASEVGNVFDLGQKYSKAFDVTFMDADGQKKYPIMGCYGIGISRTMGTLVEKFNDKKGIVWPKSIAPFAAHIVSLGDRSQESGVSIYDRLEKAGIEVLWDDTERTAGQKFADADLIGIPVRLVVSEKTGDKVEWKSRRAGEQETTLVSVEEAIKRLT